MKKIAILTNIITPYRLPLFNGLAEKINLDVLVCADSEENRKWKISGNEIHFRVIKLRGIEFSWKRSFEDYRFLYFKLSVIWYLLMKRPGCIIIGDASLTSYIAAFICNILGIPYFWWSEIIPFSPISRGIVDNVRAYCITHAMRVLVSGTLAKKFIEGYGVADNGIVVVPDAVDNEMFSFYYKSLKGRRIELRKKHDFSKNDIIILYVGQYIRRKRIMQLLDGFRELVKENSHFKLLLIGDGEEGYNYKKFIRHHGLSEYIRVDLYKQVEELAEMYFLADALILLSEYDPWGMVVNEAMCFALPVITSERVGAAWDLVNNKTGIKLSEEEILDARLLAKKIQEIEYFLYRRKETEREVLKTINGWNNHVAVERILSEMKKK